MRRLWKPLCSRVSIHAPAQGATHSVHYLGTGIDVSIHAPAQGATAGLADHSGSRDVSIHAPAQGATWSSGRTWRHRDVSIHAPAQGATPGRPHESRCILFQSTLPHRERHDIRREHRQIELVSIHAPAQGATGSMLSPSAFRRVSIHAPAQGATPCQSPHFH